MTEQDAQDWLDAYGTAWVTGDTSLVVSLFTDTAQYRETPFETPMKGRHAVREYWQKGAAVAQEDITFSSQVWSVSGNLVIAGWQASFRRKSTGSRVALDGVFRLKFASGRAPLLCQCLEEWWHRAET